MNNPCDFSILDSFVDSIALIDREGNIVFTNRAWNNFSDQNSGDPGKTGCGVNYLSICGNEGGEGLPNFPSWHMGILKVITREIPLFEFEYPCHSPSERRWFILRVSPVIPDEGLTMVSHINITLRKLAEEEVEAKSKNLKIINERLHSTLFKIVHDIQGPLKSISGLVSLTRFNKDAGKLPKIFDLIENSVGRLSSYVQNTLEFSMTDNLNEKVDFEHMLEEYLDSIKHQFGLDTLRIEREISQTGDFYFNRVELHSILSNLIGNAIKYRDPAKTENHIRIKIDAGGNKAIISVRDNGIGIKKENFPFVFRRGFQENEKSREGAGLGLEMVHKSVTNLGGTISFDSEWKMGTEFVVEIPNQLKNTIV